MKALKSPAIIATLGCAVLAFLALAGDAFAGTGSAAHASLGALDPVAMAGALVALRASLTELTAKAEAKIAEVRDGMTEEDQKRIEAEHTELLAQVAKVRKDIEAAEAEEAGDGNDDESDDSERDAAIDAAREAGARAERVRVAGITELAEKHGRRALGQSAVKRGVSLDAFRNELLRALEKGEAENDTSGNVRADQRIEPQARGETEKAVKRGEAITDALLHRADPSNFKPTDAGREFRGMSLIEIARDSLEVAGIRTRGYSKMEIAEKALRMGGLHTTSDFPTILANVANKTLRRAYEAAPQTWRPFTRQVTAPDFKTMSRVQMGEAPQLEKVNEHGEFKRGTIGEGKEQYAVLTFGKVVGITRQVLINDDLGAFTRIPSMFGIQAANLESDLVWAQIIANYAMGDGTALFHANHGNLGAAAGITADSLAIGFEAMRLQKGLDGKTFLNLTPRYLLIPVAAVTKAEQVLTATTPAMVATAATGIVPEYLRRLTPISEPRLDGGFTDPATGTAITGSRFNWFLAGDPAQNDTVELAYLEGNEGVYTESRMGFDIDGVEVKVRLDAGAKTIDWRSFYKNPATAL